MRGDRLFYVWLAGFWEGDGCLNLTHVHRKGALVYCYKNGKRYGPYTVKRDVPKIQVAITSTNRAVLEMIARKTGLGKVYREKGAGKIKPTKTLYSWRIQRADDVFLFLERIKPYLQFRRGEVERKLRKFLRESGEGEAG